MDKNVITFGETGTKFYMIIKGVVSVEVRNPQIQDWTVAKRDYEKLKAWKRVNLDPRILKAKNDTYEQY